MRMTMLWVGAALILVGIIWTLQGFNFLPGSFMTGQPFWANTGLLLLLVGAIVCVVAWRRGAA